MGAHRLTSDLWKGRSVLLTGGSGFIGAALARRLLHWDARLYLLHRSVDFQRPLFGQPTFDQPPLTSLAEATIFGDVASAEDMRRAVAVADPDFVFHLAAMTQVTEARGRWRDALETNALGTATVLEAVHLLCETRVPVIVASTDKVYGHGQAFAIEDCLRPVHPYDASKAAADIVALAFGAYTGMQVQVTRMANVYGPGDTNWKRLVPGLVRAAVVGNLFLMRSDGNQERQYLHIDDAVDAYMALAEHMVVVGPQTMPWNFGGPSVASAKVILEHVQAACSVRGLPPVAYRILNQAQDESPTLSVVDSLSQAALPWKPEIDLADGIATTFEWMLRLFNREAMVK